MRGVFIAGGMAMVVLSGCVASINANDHDGDGPHGHYRTATDLCRREVERTYEDAYRISYELPTLRTIPPMSPLPAPGGTAPVPDAIGTQQVVQQPFTITPRRDGGLSQHQTLTCTLNTGVVTAMSVDR